MELKHYQQQALAALRDYLAALQYTQEQREKIAHAAAAAGVAIPYAWDSEAWKRAMPERPAYHERRSGAGEAVPNICLKIPTGGGKTVLAVAAIDLINRVYLRRQNGLVLWIVPTSEIYRQTLRALRDRAHPYRQMLDLATGDRTLILEKDTRFSPADVRENLAILLLMLPSANRENKETLRLFKDQGGFDAFFPDEEAWAEHAGLREATPNLDTFDGDTFTGQKQIKTSLGNVLRLHQPLIILDEGHKAYSEGAQRTLYGFNPRFVLELSATPPPQSNKLVEIGGRALHREGMIKLDINLHLKAGIDWRDVLYAALDQRDTLERSARRYAQNGGAYIRPICLIQVQRTGAKQRRADLIHAEDVREHLIQRRGIPPEQIAVKSAELDELGDADLLAENCPIRYIITRQALQEGWDCPFAYVLAVLANSEAATSLTQLVGRVLRQPYARKTGQIELDECYVYCAHENTGRALAAIQNGLSQEGLGDISGRVAVVSDNAAADKVDVALRPQFQAFAGKVYLPCFVVPDDKGGFREIRYEVDILSRIDWAAFDLSAFDTLELNPAERQDAGIRVGLEKTIAPITLTTAHDGAIDLPFVTRQIIDVVPNPWVAYEYVRDAINRLEQRFSHDRIRRDMGFVIEELKKALAIQRDVQAERIFHGMINDKVLHFYLLSGHAAGAIPERIQVRAGAHHLTNEVGAPLQRNLFDWVPEDDFNELEQAVALYLDEQRWILGWYRNAVRLGYSIQGWQKNRVFPDFVAMRDDASAGSSLPTPHEIYVLETKGIHLKNEDTAYKERLFDLCNTESKPRPWDAIAGQFSNHTVHFQVVFDKEWQTVLNALVPTS